MKHITTILTLILLTSCAPCHKWAEAVRAGREPDARTVCRCYRSEINQMSVSGYQFQQGFEFHFGQMADAGYPPEVAADTARARMVRWVRSLGAEGIGDVEATEWIVPLYGRDLVGFKTRTQ